jgi:hypothetical protein
MKLFIFDTNILISALLSHAGNEATLLNMWTEKKFNLAVTPQILEEYGDVLFREKFRYHPAFSQTKTEYLLNRLRVNTLHYTGTHEVEPLSSDRDDEIFIACAVEAQADILVTGDTKHLLPLDNYGKTKILTSKEALHYLNPNPIIDLIEVAKRRGVSAEQLLKKKLTQKKKAA